MAQINVSASNAAVGSQSAIATALASPIGISIGDDWKIFDGVESATYRRVPSSSVVVHGKVVPTGPATVEVVVHALRREINSRLISSGQFSPGDVIFEIPTQELGSSPTIGDRITVGGVVYSVLRFDLSTLRTRWRCYARVG